MSDDLNKKRVEEAKAHAYFIGAVKFIVSEEGLEHFKSKEEMAERINVHIKRLEARLEELEEKT